jgi:alcohol dehydrogenase (cytochrome c)
MPLRVALRTVLRIVLAVFAAAVTLDAQVTFDRILHGDREPQNWLSYSGTPFNQRYSPLTQITPLNVKNLQLQWVWQARSLEKFEATPLVVDGVMYTVEAPNNVVALDAATGRPFWTFTYTPAPEGRPCCGRVNRGVAILGNTLYMGTIDAHLIAVDARSGQQIWNSVVADAKSRYSITHTPLIVKDKVIIGTGGGDGPIRGYISAFDAKTGVELWRFYTIPASGEPGNETWSGESWKTGGAGVWNAGAYDPETNLVFYGTGNPSPDWDGRKRLGDNLYSDSVVALDADTGKLKWHYQFTPHDELDYDSTQSDVVGQSQRRDVRPRPNDGRVPQGQAIREDELAGWLRRRRTSQPREVSDTRGHADPSARARRHQLGASRVQSADRPVLRRQLGELGHGRRRGPVPARRQREQPPDRDGPDEPGAVLQQRD